MDVGVPTFKSPPRLWASACQKLKKLFFPFETLRGISFFLS
ncbi:hypothetical protein LEP1GSC185_0578 [Leptospira licerasiae serovar Varillal str. VAR 010]|uniref:Uncharacterized protein n=1 Tax=Leptospira licerasiae str. MMD4847 TaxID=1049971 RepID=A0ABP2RE75_9LEPT|nr:hypothetical protein LEP1GSC185_0578 [Leptospira licerasiae serovar Varillal str. VAR 010]EJZ41627.1 hypothetical protein LEP1GSC178_3964 [Leptospira licerasiae str. MMD4847]